MTNKVVHILMVKEEEVEAPVGAFTTKKKAFDWLMRCATEFGVDREKMRIVTISLN